MLLKIFLVCFYTEICCYTIYQVGENFERLKSLSANNCYLDVTIGIFNIVGILVGSKVRVYVT